MKRKPIVPGVVQIWKPGDQHHREFGVALFKRGVLWAVAVHLSNEGRYHHESRNFSEAFLRPVTKAKATELAAFMLEHGKAKATDSPCSPPDRA